MSNNSDEFKELITTLVVDVIESYKIREKGNEQSWRRTHVRAVFALIEGVTYRFKRAVIEGYKLKGLEFSEAEIVLLKEESYDMNDKGDPYTQPKYFQISKNLRFTFKAYAKLHGSSYELSVADEGWASFKKSIEIRNRITHPKRTTDLYVSDEDMRHIQKASDWFRKITSELSATKSAPGV